MKQRERLDEKVATIDKILATFEFKHQELT